MLAKIYFQYYYKNKLCEVELLVDNYNGWIYTIKTKTLCIDRINQKSIKYKNVIYESFRCKIL